MCFISSSLGLPFGLKKKNSQSPAVINLLNCAHCKKLIEIYLSLPTPVTMFLFVWIMKIRTKQSSVWQFIKFDT